MSIFDDSFLTSLPDINFAEKDTELILQEVIAKFEQETGRTLFPGDPLRLLLNTFVYYLSLQRSKIDFTGKQNLLRYATDGFIQNIAALVGVQQLEAKPAITTLQFTLSTTLPDATTIQAGTRATPGNNIYFATTQDAEVPAGELTVTVLAECNQVGVIGNGFLPGQINRLVDTFPFSHSVSNIDITQGGADEEDIESLRERTHLAPESFAAAGPKGAYIFWAKTANQSIVDVSVESPSPGVVEIIPLLQGGKIPDQAILDDVYAVVDDDRRRPLTDMVVVRKPEAVVYSISLTYYISRRNSSIGLGIQQNVAKAVDEFILWQKSALGRDVNPSQLTKMLMRQGIKRVEIREPTFTPLQYYELGICDMESLKVVYGGLEND